MCRLLHWLKNTQNIKKKCMFLMLNGWQRMTNLKRHNKVRVSTHFEWFSILKYFGNQATSIIDTE